MRIQFFEKINKKDLIKDENIYFLVEGKHIHLNQKGHVKDYFKEDNKVYKIIVVDQEDKLVGETPQNKNQNIKKYQKQ